MAKLYVSNKNESARLFQNDFLEFFTHVHWTVPIIIFLPIVTYLIVHSAQTDELTSVAIFFSILAGLFVWTLTEYLLHRFVFHYRPSSDWGKKLHFLMHGIHHDYPQDATRLVMPPAVSLPLAALFYLFFLVVLPLALVFAFFAGFLIGYMCYDEIHYATHHAPMKGRIGLWLKHHHVRHHYLDPDRGYGVSSPLWDLVFGTMYQEQERVNLNSEQT
jgi:sterol desaturase/sphingolipid hydroxylase (fatty acid hydroxylase superfamily)